MAGPNWHKFILAATALLTIAFGQPGPTPPDAYQIGTASNLDKVDSFVNLSNVTSGGICANTYVFDANEQMVACCSSLLAPTTPTQQYVLSARSDLISNTLTPAVPTSIKIRLVASAPNGSVCSATTPTVANLVSGMRPTLSPIRGVGGVPFQQAQFSGQTGSPDNLTSLTTFCRFIQSSGSGFGICKTGRLAATTTTTLTASPNPSTLSQPVTLTATVTPGATGNVSFNLGTVPLGTSPVVSGTATLITRLLPAGTFPLRAIYSGDLTHTAGTSPAVPVTVKGLPATDFSPAVTFAAGTNPYTVAVGDFNRDGKADLAMFVNNYTSLGARLVIFLGDGRGGFTQAPGSPLLVGAEGGVGSLAVADYNGDGIPDVAVTSAFDGTLLVLLGKGDGTFTAAGARAMQLAKPVSLGVGDFNADGIADLAVVNLSGTPTITILLGNGDGTFRFGPDNPYPLPPFPPGDGIYFDRSFGLVVGDFNGDGLPDLAVSNEDRPVGQPGAIASVTVLLGTGAGRFSNAPGSPIAGGIGSSSLAVADFNGDGISDLALVDGYYMRVWLGSSSGIFTRPSGNPFNIFLTGITPTPADAAVIDFNGDGKPDVIISEGGKLLVMVGDGTGNFSVRVATPSTAQLDTVAVGDFNGDGKSDVAVGASVLLAIGPPAVITPTAGTAQSAAAGSAFATALQAKVVDGSNNALSGVSVTFTGPTAGASGTFVGVTNPPTIQTDASGLATAPIFTANCTIGTYTVTASVPGLTSAAFNLTNTLGPPSSVTLVSGAGQSAGASTVFASPLRVIVTDACGNSIPGVTVVFTAPPSGASGSFAGGATIASVPTNSSGIATAPPFTANCAVGAYSVTAIVSSLPPLPFTLTNTPGLPATITAASGGGQSAFVNTAFTNPLVANVKDSCNNFVPSGTVVFTAPLLTGASANFAPSGISSASVPISSGVATTPTLTANAISGTYNVSATIGSASATFQLTNKPPAISTSTTSLTISPPGSSALSQPVTLTANVTPSSATGSVTFSSGTTLIGTAPLSGGQASIITRLLPAGTGRLRATYSGNPTHAASTSAGVLHIVDALPATSFAGALNLAVGQAPGALEVADFNGDGASDIVVANYGSNNVSVLLGDGAGGFTPAPGSPLLVGNVPQSVAVGDFNGDGNTDIVVANNTSQTITVLLGNGRGLFTPAPGSPFHTFGESSSSPYSLAVGDFNGDGVADLAVLAVPGTIWVLLGNGDGTFVVQPATYSNGAVPEYLVAGDFNGDGFADLAVANDKDNTVTVLLGSSNGTFAAAPGSPFPVGRNPRGLAVGDFNVDGFSDLVVGNAMDTTATVLLGNATGRLTQSPGSPFSIAGFLNSPAITVGDFNGDGKLDFAVDGRSGSVVVMLGDGSGRFAIDPARSLSVGTAPSAMVAGDFNQDGRTDLAVAYWLDINVRGTVSVLLGVGPPNSIEVASGYGQMTVVNTAFQNSLGALVKDVSGNVVPNASVTFTAPSSGPSILGSPATIKTDNNGVATLRAPTANGFSGQYTVTATISEGSGAFGPAILLTNIAKLVMTSSCPANGKVGSPFSFLLTATGGTTPYVWSAAPLPEGLVINSATGSISWSPTASGTFPITFQVIDSGTGSLQQIAILQCRIVINPPPPMPPAGCPATGIQGSPYSFPITVTGGAAPFTWSLAGSTPLPPGLNLNQATGTISGTPATPRTYPISIRITDSSSPPQTAIYTCNIVILPGVSITTACPVSTVRGVPFTLGLTATGGTPPYLWTVGGSLPPGIAQNGSAVVGIPNTPGAYPITLSLVDSGSGPLRQTATLSCGITVTAPTPLPLTPSCPANSAALGDPYSSPLSTGGGNGPFIWTVASGGLPAGLSINGSVLTGVPKGPVGPSTFSLQVSSGDQTATTASCTIQVNPARLQLTSGCPAGAATIGAPYGPFPLTATGGNGAGTYSYSVVQGSLPAGVFPSGATIAGTPNGPPGVSTFQVQVQSGTQTAVSGMCSVTVAGPLLTVTGTCPTGVLGSDVSSTLSVGGGQSPYTFTLSSGPDWLTLTPNGSSARVSGKPPDAGSFPFSVTVTDAANSTPAKFSCSLTVTLAPLQITGGTCPSSVAVSSPYSTSLDASGGRTPYHWSATGSSWLSVNPTVGSSTTLSGTTPSTPGTYSVGATLTDSGGSQPVSFSCQLNVLKAGEGTLPPLVIAGTCPASSLVLPATITSPLTARGGSGNYTWTVSPTWLKLGPTTGPSTTVSGTPPGPGPVAFTVTLNDDAGTTAAALPCDVMVIAPLSVTGTESTAKVTDPVTATLKLDAPTPIGLQGDVQLTFTPNAFGLTDNPQVGFIPPPSGPPTYRLWTFALPANTQALPLPSIQQGMVAGTICAEVVRLQDNGRDVLPVPHPSYCYVVPRLAPVITGPINFENETANGFDIVISGYSTPREITGVTITFTTAEGAEIQGSPIVLTDQIRSVFTNFYSSQKSQAGGSMFTGLRIGIVLDGDKTAIGAVTVVMTNPAGSSDPVSKNR